MLLIVEYTIERYYPVEIGGDLLVMADDKNQRNAFDFLLEHFKSGEAFLKEDLCSVTTWTGSSFPTYWSKQFIRFVVPVGKDQFRVSEAFRPFMVWKEFQRHVTQTRGALKYESLLFDNIVTFEFFMPLTNEGHLRVSLDALFYLDTLRRGVRYLNREKLTRFFPLCDGEGNEDYVERVARWIGERFGGYGTCQQV